MHKLLISKNMHFPFFKAKLVISRLGSKRNTVVPVKLLIMTRGNAHKNQLFGAWADKVSNINSHGWKSTDENPRVKSFALFVWIYSPLPLALLSPQPRGQWAKSRLSASCVRRALAGGLRRKRRRASDLQCIPTGALNVMKVQLVRLILPASRRSLNETHSHVGEAGTPGFEPQPPSTPISGGDRSTNRGNRHGTG